MGAHLRRGTQGLSEGGPRGPAIIVHSLAHAVAALQAAAETGIPVVLLSAADAGIYAGAGWFKALVEAAREAVPAANFSAILDCGDSAGAAQATLRAGIKTVIFIGRADVAERLAGIATGTGARVLTERPAALLDLGELFFASSDTLRGRCTDALASV